jgi:hypothetical protein
MSKPRKVIVRRLISTVFDKRLYGLRSFVFLSGPFLAIGFIIQVSIYLAISPLQLFIYAPLFVVLILVSGIGSKNLGKENNNVGFYRGFLFFMASILASVTPFLVKLPSDPNQASFQFLLLSGVSAIALIIAIIDITVCGQRISLRESMKLTNTFFKKQKTVWEKKLVDFPNAKKIINKIDGCLAIPMLFDKGSFGLAILWSCNIIEQTTDAAADGIISKDPSKKYLFRRDDNGLVRYSKQLSALGFELNFGSQPNEERITLEILWHEIRRNIAHYNYRPTFEEMSGTAFILTSFVEQIPDLLKKIDFSKEE